jgi:hypothetical protein
MGCCYSVHFQVTTLLYMTLIQTKNPTDLEKFVLITPT